MLDQTRLLPFMVPGGDARRSVFGLASPGPVRTVPLRSVAEVMVLPLLGDKHIVSCVLQRLEVVRAGLTG